MRKLLKPIATGIRRASVRLGQACEEIRFGLFERKMALLDVIGLTERSALRSTSEESFHNLITLDHPIFAIYVTDQSQADQINYQLATAYGDQATFFIMEGKANLVELLNPRIVVDETEVVQEEMIRFNKLLDNILTEIQHEEEEDSSL